VSEDGTSWGELKIVASTLSHWKTIILNPPRAALDSLGMEIDWITESCFTVKESEDGGDSFRTAIEYKQPMPIDRQYLSCHDVAMEDSMAYFTAERNDIFGSEIYSISYVSADKDVTSLQRIDPDSTGSFRPRLGTGNGALHVVWCDLSDGFMGIYHRKSSDSGVTFSAPVLVSEEGVDSWNPDLSVDGSTLIIVWEDYRDGWGEVYSRRSTDGGATWASSLRETFTAGFSVHPMVESREGFAYLTWQDLSSGNWEVNFKPLP
jgi:hypothetical protein